MPWLLALLLLVPMPVATAETLQLTPPVVLRAAAVAETANGLVGSSADITVTAASNGSGHIFLDTFPLAEVDMQGSARLAVRVASQTVGIPWRDHDFFFVIRSNSPLIGGPSAGSTLTMGALATLTGWEVREDVMMTGTINPDGSIGPVGGVAEKAQAARNAGLTRFLFPAAQEVVQYQGGAVNVTQYCKAQLGIECVPVADIIDAVGLMTDHVIERPPVPDNVTDETYRAILTPLSGELVERAEATIIQAEQRLATLNDTQQRVALEGRLVGARALFDRAQSAFGNATYYTAASLSFQSSIESHAVRDIARMLSSDEQSRELGAIVNDSIAAVTIARQQIETARALDAADFQKLGSAQVRLQEAEQRLARAQEFQRGAADLSAASQAVYEAAYASERAFTATWWLKLTQDETALAPLDEAHLADTARETLSAAREAVAYIDSVLTQIFPQGIDTGAAAILANAEAARERGFHSAAILEALEAEVRAASYLEAASYGGAVPDSKFESVRANAARAIEAARARGVEPFVAQSQYEFGLTLDDPIEKLTFLGLARVTANLAGLPTDLAIAQPVENRFQGVPRFPGAPPAWIPAAFAVGLALGVGAGLTALMPKRDPEASANEPVSPPPRLLAAPRTGASAGAEENEGAGAPEEERAR